MFRSLLFAGLFAVFCASSLQAGIIMTVENINLELGETKDIRVWAQSSTVASFSNLLSLELQLTPKSGTTPASVVQIGALSAPSSHVLPGQPGSATVSVLTTTPPRTVFRGSFFTNPFAGEPPVSLLSGPVLLAKIPINALLVGNAGDQFELSVNLSNTRFTGPFFTPIASGASSGMITLSAPSSTSNPIPEPSSFLLVAIGGVGLLGVRRRKSVSC